MINQDGENLQNQASMSSKNQLSMAQSIKNQINECLDQAEKRPQMKKKILESLNDLEEQLNDIRAEEGYLAQMRAQ